MIISRRFIRCVTIIIFVGFVSQSKSAQGNSCDEMWGGNCVGWLKNCKGIIMPYDLTYISDKKKHITEYQPAEGLIAVMEAPGKFARYGHVAKVKSVNTDGTITVEEANYPENKVGQRKATPVAMKIIGYIRPNNWAATGNPDVTYIYKKTGFIQNNDPCNWKPNIDKSRVQEGDVAIIKNSVSCRVAYVEKIYNDHRSNFFEVHVSGMVQNDLRFNILKSGEIFGFWRPSEINLDTIKGLWRGFITTVDKTGNTITSPFSITINRLSDTSFDGKVSEFNQFTALWKIKMLKYDFKIVEAEYNSNTKKIRFGAKDPFYFGFVSFAGNIVNEHKIIGEITYSYNKTGKFELTK